LKNERRTERKREQEKDELSYACLEELRHIDVDVIKWL
jgi:hypothetical protein